MASLPSPLYPESLRDWQHPVECSHSLPLQKRAWAGNKEGLCVPFPPSRPHPLLPSLSVFSSLAFFLCRGHCALEQRCQESQALSLFTLLLFHLAFHLRVCHRIRLFKQNLVYISTQDVYFGSVWPKLDIFFSLEVFLQPRALLGLWRFRNSLKAHFSN